MRVKIGDTWYDSKDQWLGVQLEPKELDAMKKMDTKESNRSIAAGTPTESDGADMLEWLREGR